MERLALTYTEYLDTVKESYDSLAKHPIFDIPEKFSEIAFKTWIDEYSQDYFYTYLAYILKMPDKQEHLDIDNYLFTDSRDIFINLLNTLFDTDYFHWGITPQEELEFLIKTMDEIKDKSTFKSLNMDMLKEEIDRQRLFNEKVNDDD